MQARPQGRQKAKQQLDAAQVKAKGTIPPRFLASIEELFFYLYLFTDSYIPETTIVL